MPAYEAALTLEKTLHDLPRQMLATAVSCGQFRIREVPISTRYATDSSSASIYHSLKYVVQTIMCLVAIWRRRAALKEQIGGRLREIDITG